MLKSLSEAKSSNSNKQFCPIFLRSPIRVDGDSKVESMEFSVNKIQDNQAIPTDEIEKIETNLVCRSIGYKSINVDEDINFDSRKGLVKNIQGKNCSEWCHFKKYLIKLHFNLFAGRVLKKESDEIQKGLYVSGWLGTGPIGVILTTMNSSFGIADSVCQDFKNQVLVANSQKQGLNFNNYRTVYWKDWQKIDKYEEDQGKKAGKLREKIISIEKMLEVAGV